MDRREFLKKSLAMGIGAGVLFLPKGIKRAAMAAATTPDMVAVKGSTPERMFDRGMKELGGMGRFVKRGQTVVIKPNMSWDMPESMASNTSPALVAAVIKHCLDAGAKRVTVMDNSIEHWERTLGGSGVGAAIKSAGGVYVPSHSQGTYQKTSVKGGTLKEALIHESILEAQVFISVPVLKHHGGAGVSISAKNLMGCVWDRRHYHASGLHECIAEFMNARKPDLNVVDAHRVITRNGPRGGSDKDVAQMNSLIITPDVVAADAAGAKMLGRDPMKVDHIRLAAAAGMGQIDTNKLDIRRVVM